MNTDSARGTAFLPIGERRPSIRLGVLASLLSVAVATVAIYPLKSLAPVVSLSVVYLPAVLLLSTFWGLAAGLGTALLSAVAFNFFHIPPTGRFSIADSRNWAALAAFVIVAVAASAIAEVARIRSVEADRRAAEADLAAVLARELLAGTDTRQALAAAAHQLALALDLRSAAIELGPPADDRADPRREVLTLSGESSTPIGSLVVGADVPPETMQRLQSRLIPTLEAIVAIALRRDELVSETVQTEALRRSDEVKTALLQAVSHDLRTPLTAIVAAGHALGSETIDEADRRELAAAVVSEGERLSSLVEKLLDLSRLQGGGAHPHRDWVSIEDVVVAARDGLGLDGPDVRISVPADLPAVEADATQLERVFANLLENALRYAGSGPVAVSASQSGTRLLVSVTDQGPGLPPSELDRIFEPFYRGPLAGENGAVGSGLGLSIARGFTEANGGTLTAQSLPGQGTTFVVALPV